MVFGWEKLDKKIIVLFASVIIEKFQNWTSIKKPIVQILMIKGTTVVGVWKQWFIQAMEALWSVSRE